MTKHRRLTERQYRFVHEYLVDLHGRDAAIRAGYSRKGAAVAASKNLADERVRKAMREAMADREARTQISQDRIIKELAAVAFSDPRPFFDECGNLLPVKDLPDDLAAALSSMEIEQDRRGTMVRLAKVRRFDKTKCLELLMRHMGMLQDRVQFEGQGGGPVVVEIVRFGDESKAAG